MMELNKVFLIGNLTRDPESRFLANGTQVCKLSLAANRRYTANGEKKEEVLFIDIETWAKTAELCAQYLRKGSEAMVEGRLKMDTFQTKEGEKRTKLLIVAERVQFGARESSGGEARQAPRKEASAAPADKTEAPAADPNDDLPF